MSRIFQRALGCICTVFRSCGCSTSRSHPNPARSGKKSHKSLRVSSNCHVWWKRWTNMYQDFYHMYPMRLDVCVCPSQSQCWTHITCRNVWDLDFKNWVVPCVFSLLNGLTPTQITVLSLQNMWLHIQRMVVGTGGMVLVCCLSHTEKISLLWMWTGRNSTKRDTQEKPLENWYWAQCLFPGICEESHLKEVDRPSFTFLKLFFKKVRVMKYRSQMHYRNQLDKNPNGFGMFTTDSWLCCVQQDHFHRAGQSTFPYPLTFWLSFVCTPSLWNSSLCVHTSHFSE